MSKDEIQYWSEIGINLGVGHQKRFCQKYLDMFNDIVKLPMNKLCCEVGPGPFGGMATVFKASTWIMVDPLCDVYASMVSKLDNTVYLNTNAEEMSIGDHTVDTVFSTNALDHTYNRKMVIKEIYRILKEEGLFCLMVHCRTPKQCNDQHPQHFTIDDIINEIASVGFHVEGYKSYTETYTTVIGVFRKTKDKSLQQQINSLSPWYVPVDFGHGCRTHSHKWSDKDFYAMRTFGIKKWITHIVPFLPFNLRNKKLLDIGCNAGLHLIEATKLGAKCYGLEANAKFYNQCVFVLNNLSTIDEVDYKRNIDVILTNALQYDFLDTNLKPIKFDITIAANALYWLTYSDNGGEITNALYLMDRFVERLSEHTEYLLVVCDQLVSAYRERVGKGRIGTGSREVFSLLRYTFDKVDSKDFGKYDNRHPYVILLKSKNYK